MLIVAKYNNSTIIVDTTKRDWRYVATSTPKVDEMVLDKIVRGEYTPHQTTQEEIG
jgi:hypothetical protein